MRNARSGFFAETEIRSVVSGLPRYLQSFNVSFSCITSMRTDEVRSVRWSEAHGNAIPPRAENSKNGEGRTIVLEGFLYAFPVEAPTSVGGVAGFSGCDGLCSFDPRALALAGSLLLLLFCFRRLPTFSVEGSCVCCCRPVPRPLLCVLRASVVKRCCR